MYRVSRVEAPKSICTLAFSRGGSSAPQARPSARTWREGMRIEARTVAGVKDAPVGEKQSFTSIKV